MRSITSFIPLITASTLVMTMSEPVDEAVLMFPFSSSIFTRTSASAFVPPVMASNLVLLQLDLGEFVRDLLNRSEDRVNGTGTSFRDRHGLVTYRQPNRGRRNRVDSCDYRKVHDLQERVSSFEPDYISSNPIKNLRP